MGVNDNKQIYDGLHVIFKDADQIDRFARNSKNPPVQKQKLAIGDDNYKPRQPMRIL
jgi:hypothetical protein